MLKMPSLLYGGESVAHLSSAEDISRFKSAISANFLGFDSAAMTASYGEKEIGLASAQHKKNNLQTLWMQTKFTPCLSDHQSYQLVYNINAPVYDQIFQSLQYSINKLGKNTIDSYLLHCPSAGMYRRINNKDIEIWKGLEQARNSGLINQIGVSDIYKPEIQKLSSLARIKPAIVQNIGLDLSELEYCLESGIIYQSVQLIVGNLNFLSDTDISKIAHKYNATNSQILVSFVRSIGVVPVLGTTNTTRMQEYTKVDFELNNADFKEVALSLPNSKKIIDIYEKIQRGELFSLEDVIKNIIKFDIDDLFANYPNILSYIQKLDPYSLAYIIANSSVEKLHFLKNHGAHLELLNSFDIANIAANIDYDVISELRKFSDIPQEKFLLALTNDDEVFSEVLSRADLNNLSSNEIIAISKSYPDFLETIRNLVQAEKLLLPSIAAHNTSLFNFAVATANLNKLNSHELFELVKAKGKTIISNLVDADVNFASFSKLYFTELKEEYDIDLAKILDNQDIWNQSLPYSDIENSRISNYEGYEAKKHVRISDLLENDPTNRALKNYEGHEILGGILRHHTSSIYKSFTNQIENNSLPQELKDELKKYNQFELSSITKYHSELSSKLLQIGIKAEEVIGGSYHYLSKTDFMNLLQDVHECSIDSYTISAIIKKYSKNFPDDLRKLAFPFGIGTECKKQIEFLNTILLCTDEDAEHSKEQIVHCLGDNSTTSITDEL